jgi:hypothetical protein
MVSATPHTVDARRKKAAEAALDPIYRKRRLVDAKTK